MAPAAEARVGISGWNYPSWRASFYPAGLPHAQELAYASHLFRAIEINGTFYSQKTPDVFARWAAETPEDFVFAVKGSRFITHMKRLRDTAVPLANFFASGLLRLGAKLGPILWQLPPSFAFDRERLDGFFSLLPRDTEAAVACARKHDRRLKARGWLRSDAHRPLRHALEVRHESFRDPAFVDLLRERDIALVCADTVDWPLLMDLTSDFVYCRLHGSTELYRSRYSAQALDRWADRIRAWSTGKAMTDGTFIEPSAGEPWPRDVFVFFDNTDKRHAPGNALALARRINPMRSEAVPSWSSRSGSRSALSRG
jgi:uncharacterized protein YecE (DUF72 family)